MCEVDVDVIDAETLEARFELPRDARAREAAVLAGVHRVEGLGGDLRAVPAAHDPLPDCELASSTAVRVGRIERCHAQLPGAVHDRERLVVSLPVTEEPGRGADAAEVAAAQDDARDVDTARAQLTAFHCSILAEEGGARGACAVPGQARRAVRCFRRAARRASHSAPTPAIQSIAAPSGAGVNS